MVICLKPCTPKPDQITIDFTNYWKLFKGGHDMSIHVLWRLSTWSLEIPVTSSSLCPPAFSVLDKKSHTKAKIAGAFRTWTSSCKWCKWWSRLTNCQLKTKKCHSLQVIYVMSIHFICLSRGEIVILLHPVNHNNASLKNIHRSTLYQRRPSICRETAWTIEDRSL